MLGLVLLLLLGVSGTLFLTGVLSSQEGAGGDGRRARRRAAHVSEAVEECLGRVLGRTRSQREKAQERQQQQQQLKKSQQETTSASQNGHDHDDHAQQLEAPLVDEDANENGEEHREFTQAFKSDGDDSSASTAVRDDDLPPPFFARDVQWLRQLVCACLLGFSLAQLGIALRIGSVSVECLALQAATLLLAVCLLLGVVADYRLVASPAAETASRRWAFQWVALLAVCLLNKLAVAELGRHHMHQSARDALGMVSSGMAVLAGLGLVVKLLENATQHQRIHRFERVTRSTLTPEHQANMPSHFTMSWITSLVNLGYQRQLELSDVPTLADFDQSSTSGEKLQRILREEYGYGRKPPAGNAGGVVEPGHLWRALVRVAGWPFALAAMFRLFSSCSSFVPPLVLWQIIWYVDNHGSEEAQTPSMQRRVVLAAVALFVAPMLRAISDGQYFHNARRSAIRVRGSLATLIYDKALRMSVAGAGQTIGQMTNLLAVDCEVIKRTFIRVHLIWAGVLEISIVFVCLFVLMGWPAAIGTAVLFCGTFTLGVVMKQLREAQRLNMQARDVRMSACSEILQGIKVVKLNAWEQCWAKRVGDLRATELGYLKRYMILMSTSEFLFDGLPSLISLSAFFAYSTLAGHDLDPWTAFSASALFAALRFPMAAMPTALGDATQAVVSMRRICNLLRLPNTSPRRFMLANGDLADTGEVIMRQLTVAWPTICETDEEATSSGKTADQDTDDEEDQGRPCCGCWVGQSRSIGPRRHRLGGGVAGYAKLDQSQDNGAMNSATEIEMQQQQQEKQQQEMHAAQGGSATPSATVSRESTEQAPTVVLRDVTFTAKPGDLVCIVGPTGSGKSSLLETLLGETIVFDGGDWAVGGDVAYVAQKPWIRNATLRDNILFGKPMDEARYKKVIKVCSLEHDLSILLHGDLTEIGERGVNLSGGQQQRVNLARAVYHDADVFLLDDVLSAVDAHVGEHLFKECILRQMRGKTRILATHQLPLTLPHANLVVMLDASGRVCRQCSGREFMETFTQPPASLGVEESKNGTGGANCIMLNAPMLSAQRNISSSSTASTVSSSSCDDGNDRVSGGREKEQEKGGIVDVEERAKGAPSLQVYLSYVRSMGGYHIGALFVLLMAGAESAGLLQNYAVSRWTQAVVDHERQGPAFTVYVLATVLVLCILAVVAVFVVLVSLHASRFIHDAMLGSILRAPLEWFESTPTGRILNRLSSDLAEIDASIVSAIRQILMFICSALVVISVLLVELPVMLLAMLPYTLFTAFLGRKYLSAQRDVKRLDSLQKSPLFALFGETLSGVSTVRAFRQQAPFAEQFHRRVDNSCTSFFHMWALNRWLNVRVQLAGSLVMGVAGVFVLLNVNHMQSSVAGLVLLYCSTFTTTTLYFIRQTAQLEMSFNSVERTDVYSNLEQEPPASVPGHAPSASWPERGHIEFRNVTMRYPSNPETAVLKGVSLDIPGGTRVGIVGRTGAGKSSLLSAIFRLVEPDLGSAIVIDGHDVLGAFGLADLRGRLAIVPQDPVLFQGTIRSNLDPFDEYSDEALWDGLRKAHMSTAISGLIGGLSAPVTEHGKNFSVGERQLLCMARAILKQSHVMIMDEATANVDPETDGLIQETVRDALGACTVLCIAHRLHTVAYYDRVAVMDDGHVVEYDTPATLLRRENGAFRALCERSGNLDQLIALAGNAGSNGTVQSHRPSSMM